MANAVTKNQTLLLGDESAGTIAGVTSGTSKPIPSAGAGIVTFYFRSVGTTSGGTVLIEEADWVADEKQPNVTWSQVASVAASTFTGGAIAAYHVTNSAYGYLRVRISSNITGGGSVIVTLRSQGAGS